MMLYEMKSISPCLMKEGRVGKKLHKMLRCIRFINEMLAKIENLWKDLEHHSWFNDQK